MGYYEKVIIHFCSVFIFVSSFVISNELHDGLEKSQFFTLDQEWFYFDSAWGVHEWQYKLSRTFNLDSENSELFITLLKSKGWKVEDQIYIDPTSAEVYNLRTKQWVIPFEMQFLP